MSDQDELFYQQAIARRTMLGLLRRLCMGQHRDTLLKAICVGSLPKPLNQALAEWNQIVLQDMENLIRQDVGQYGQLVRQAMALLFDHEGQAQRIATILEPLRKAWQRNNSQRIEQLLWNVLSQHFKDKMDQLDGAGGGPGVHQLQVMRRLEPLSRELESQRGNPTSIRPNWPPTSWH
ncbi:MAG: hypothetical protein HC808_19730 [Candidatus Competibacteraceae bacterium]|nr:hypothetical protein [Candidatus Competibacteraceae bacterium]